MDLAVAKALLGVDVVLVGDGAAVLDLPVLAVLEGRHVFAVEQHDGVRRRAAGLARGDDRRLGPDDRCNVLAAEELPQAGLAGKGQHGGEDEGEIGETNQTTGMKTLHVKTPGGKGGWESLTL